MTIPPEVDELLRSCLVAEVTHFGRERMYTDPMIPLWDGERIMFTSSILFSRKLERIKRDPRVSVSISDPVACPGTPLGRASIQGDARVLDGDLHEDWMRVLPLWEQKEPAVGKLLRMRFGLPLFWERSVIEVTPRRVLYWPQADTSRAPAVTGLEAAP
jgi:general stress protein 26